MKRIVVSEATKRHIAMMAGGLGISEGQLLEIVTPMLQAAFNQSEMSVDSFRGKIKAAGEYIANTVTNDKPKEDSQ